MAQYDPSTGSGGRRWETIAAAQKNSRGRVPGRPWHPRRRRRHDEPLRAQRQRRPTGYWGTARPRDRVGLDARERDLHALQRQLPELDERPDRLQARVSRSSKTSRRTCWIPSTASTSASPTSTATRTATNNGGLIAYAMEDIDDGARSDPGGDQRARAGRQHAAVGNALRDRAVLHGPAASLYGNPGGAWPRRAIRATHRSTTRRSTTTARRTSSCS